MGNWCSCCRKPRDSPSPSPTPRPSPRPRPSYKPSHSPSPRQSPRPSPSPSPKPSPSPRQSPSPSRSPSPTPNPRSSPGYIPSLSTMPSPSSSRTPRPSPIPSPRPSASPTLDGGSTHVKTKCKSKVYEEISSVSLKTERVSTTPESDESKIEWLDSLALLGYHQRNISVPVMAQEQDKKNSEESPGHLTQRWRSYPTVFLYEDTASQPDLSTTLQAVSMAIYNNIRYRDGNRSSDIFDERIYPIRHHLATRADFLRDPKPQVIYKFVCTLFSAEPLTAATAIVTLIYLERLKRYVSIDVCPTNWKRILLGAANMAYESWSKQALWNPSYIQLINNIVTDEDMDEIERHFLCYIDFDTDVPASLYAKYYFDLRYLAHENNPLVPVKSLCKERSQSTEAISRCYWAKDVCRPAIKRSRSTDSVIGMHHTKSMLSSERNEGLEHHETLIYKNYRNTTSSKKQCFLLKVAKMA